MNARMDQLKVVLGALAVVFMSSCGVAVDPLKAISQETFPQLSYFTSSTSTVSAIITPYRASTPYWDLNPGLTAFGGSFMAPADGTVTQIGTTTVSGGSSNFITIAHSSRLATKFYGVQQIVVRVGDFVSQRQTIGIFFTTGSLFRFQVLLDGNPVCPLSFMSSELLTQFAYNSFGTPACQ